MKKLGISLAIVFAIGFISCGGSKSDSESEDAYQEDVENIDESVLQELDNTGGTEEMSFEDGTLDADNGAAAKE